ncbi:hypothetical protein [Lysinibacillus pakistanensis]|uniref:hypothetical protein n=1 Tax=Lysinibacillus pakistanensis TaxID=759811 RepID=UPI003D2A40A4
MLLYELTVQGNGWVLLWLVYFIPSLILQALCAFPKPLLVKEKMLQNIQLIRAGAYILPLVGYLIGTDVGTILGLVVLQCLLGLMQPIYASLSFLASTRNL